MYEIVHMSWVFAVVFISIFALMVAFAVMALAKQAPLHRKK